MVVAFDFDGTIENKLLLNFAKKLVKEKNEVWIVTAREENEFNKNILQPTLNVLGLPKERVIYTNNKSKVEYLETINADLYIDNISSEFEQIKNTNQTIPLLWSNQ